MVSLESFRICKRLQQEQAPCRRRRRLLPPLCSARVTCPTLRLCLPPYPLQSLTGCAWSAALWAPWSAAWQVSRQHLRGRQQACCCRHCRRPPNCSSLPPPLAATPPSYLPLHRSTHHAAFKQQNAVHGLPLELSAEEVTLAVEKGWGELAPALDTATLAAALSGGGRKRGRQSAFQYYEDEDDLDTDMADAAAAAQQQQPAAEPTWRPALASGAAFVIPTTLAEATAANEGRSLDGGPDGADGAGGSAADAAAAGAAPDALPAAGAAEAPGVAAADAAAGGTAAAAGEAAAGGAAAAAQWSFPATQEERHRYWVFRDLHSRGCAAATWALVVWEGAAVH